LPSKQGKLLTLVAEQFQDFGSSPALLFLHTIIFTGNIMYVRRTGIQLLGCFKEMHDLDILCDTTYTDWRDYFSQKYTDRFQTWTGGTEAQFFITRECQWYRLFVQSSDAYFNTPQRL